MWQKALACFFCVCLMTGFCCASEPQAAMSSQLEALDAQLNILRDELHKLRLKSMQEEVNGQPLMFEKWADYAEHIKLAEKLEQQADEIQKQIDALQARRAQLQSEHALKIQKS